MAALIVNYALGQVGRGLAGVVVRVLLEVLAKRTMRVDQQDWPARLLVHRIILARGARFTDADRTGADFTGAVLAQSDLMLDSQIRY